MICKIKIPGSGVLLGNTHTFLVSDHHSIHFCSADRYPGYCDSYIGCIVINFRYCTVTQSYYYFNQHSESRVQKTEIVIFHPLRSIVIFSQYLLSSNAMHFLCLQPFCFRVVTSVSRYRKYTKKEGKRQSYFTQTFDENLCSPSVYKCSSFSPQAAARTP